MKYWLLLQLDSIIHDFLNSCNQDMKDVLVRHLDWLSERGYETRHPISDYLRDGLFELRGRAGRLHARLIYYFESNKRIIFVHACYKTGNRLSPGDFEIARRNKKKIEKGEKIVYVLTYTH